MMDEDAAKPVGEFVIAVRPESTYPRRHRRDRSFGYRVLWTLLSFLILIFILLVGSAVYLALAALVVGGLCELGMSEEAAYAVALPIPFVVGGFILLVRHRRRLRRFRARAFESSKSTHEVMDSLVKENPPALLAEWKAVAKSLATAGHMQRVIFVIRESRQEPLHAPPGYPIPFEPYRLNVNDPRKELLLEPLLEMVNETVAEVVDPSSEDSQDGSNPHDSGVTWRQRFKDWMRGVPNLVWTLILLFWIGRGIWRAFQTGRPNIGLIIGVLFGIAFAAQFLGGRKQWILVPGGLFLRLGRFFSSTTEIRPFTSVSSILLVTDLGVVVSDGTYVDRLVADSYELPLLISAWTSELEPPTVEQLSDLR